MDAELVSLIMGAALFGLFIGWLAWYWKAENFFLWFVFGCLFSVVTLVVLLILPTKDGALEQRAIKEGTAKRCPYCFNLIHPQATVCQFCHRDQPV